MPTWKNEHYKAISHYAKTYNYRIAMGSWPQARFVDENGKEFTVHIDDVMTTYYTNKKEEARERRRLKKEEDNLSSWQNRFRQS